MYYAHDAAALLATMLTIAVAVHFWIEGDVEVAWWFYAIKVYRIPQYSGGWITF